MEGGANYIEKFQEFFEQNYKVELLEKVRTGDFVIRVSFKNISRFDPDLAEVMLDDPEEMIKSAETAIEQLELQGHETDFRVRLIEVPESQRVLIRNIRSKHIDKLIMVEGVVRQKSDVRPQVTSARFECPACGNVITVLQLDTSFKEPRSCGCGRKGKFNLIGKEMVDAQGIVLEEVPEQLEGGEQPKRMNIFLKDDLVSPLSDKRTNPGSRILIVGQVKEVPIILKTGAKSTRFDLLIEANNVIAVKEDFTEIKITAEEKEEITELSKKPNILDLLASSLAPSIYGHEHIKEALILQLVGGNNKERDDGVRSRGDIHVLLIGDPGAGKSQMLKRVSIVAPKARYVSGKGVSGAGLTATVVKDEFLRGWSLEAGALVLANNGMCMIDEFDKMTPEDRAAMHEALEQQTVSISKANVQATLVARTTVLAAANPKFGRFDPYETISKQIDLPPTLINRFDLIFPVRDVPDKERDKQLATFILHLHQNVKSIEPEIDTNILRKYVSYARQNIMPRVGENAIQEILNYYLSMRGSGSKEGEMSRVPISARQLEALIRLSEANARIRLSQKVTKKDAKKAIDLVHYCLTQVGMDPDTGKIDIDRISTGVPSSDRTKIIKVREIINELENQLGKTIPIEEIIKEASEKGMEDEACEEAIQKLKRSGDIFEPKRGFIQKI